MRLGVILPHMGPSANPDAVIRGAQEAERLGYDSIWATDRLLSPVEPRNPYPGTPDVSFWPEHFKDVLDPIESLTFAAAHTSRIALGTSVLDIPFYNPVVLARRLTSLDVLSGGRLKVGLGLGYSDDEYDAVGAEAKVRGRRADEFLQVMKTIWTADTVEFSGDFFQVPPSIIGRKPIQKPHPPLYLAAYVAPALKRAATLANGWMPNGIPFEYLPEMLTQFREMGEAAGRDPGSLEVIMVGSVYITEEPVEKDRYPFMGSLEQIKGDFARARELGTDELILELNLGLPTDDLLALMGQMRELSQ